MKTLLAGLIALACVLCTATGTVGSTVDPAYFDVDTTAPKVTITTPGTLSSTSQILSIDLAGIASDDISVISVFWATDQGASGVCTGLESWSVARIPLAEGENVITIAALDVAGNLGSDSVIVTSSPAVYPPISMQIEYPTSSEAYSTNSPAITIEGSVSGGSGITAVTWQTDRGSIGNCTGTDRWSAAQVPIYYGKNVITVVARDAAGNTAGDTLTIIRTDAEAPTINILSPSVRPTIITTNRSLVIGGSASDNVGVAKVTWITDQGQSGVCSGVTSWSTAGLTLQKGSTVVTVIAQDEAGNVASDTVQVTYIGNDPPDEWRGFAMVSVPLIPDQPDPKLATGFAGNNWSIFIPWENKYLAYGKDSNHLTWFLPPEETPGRGFWARFAGGTKMPPGIALPQDEPAEIPLYAGWNMIGQPFLSEVVWDLSAIRIRTMRGEEMTLRDAKARRIAEDQARGWQHDSADSDKGSYYAVEEYPSAPGSRSSLAPWCAYWIMCYTDCYMILPPPE